MRVNQTNQGSVQNVDSKKTSNITQKAKNSIQEAEIKKTETPGIQSNLSTKSKEFSQAKSVAAQTPDVREEKIAEIKKRIEQDEYQVYADAVADRLVDDHLELMN